MGPRLVLVATVLAALAATCEPVTPGSSAAAAPAPPNIVFVLVDDLDKTTTPSWDAMPNTKALLADHGMAFANHFAPDPTCCPARASILTGQYAHNTGVLANAGARGGSARFRERGKESETVSVALQAAGYRTGFVGKYLNGYEDDPTHLPPGWDEWFGLADIRAYGGYDYTINENGALVAYGSTEADYVTDVLTDHAVGFIDRAEADDGRPFFALVAPTAPHVPLGPPPRYAVNEFADDVMPVRPNFFEADLSDKSWWLRMSAPRREERRAAQELEYRRRLGSLMAVDDMVTAIVAELDQSGELANTVFVFASDNGFNLGAHTLVDKSAPYEESQRVPLVIAGPGIAHGTDTHLTIQPDLAPTILELAGVPIPSTVDGRSLVPLLNGSLAGPWRADYVGQFLGGAAPRIWEPLLPPGFAYISGVFVSGTEVPTYRMIRTERFKYVEYLWYDDVTIIGTELYNLTTDPYELSNILATPEGRTAAAPLVGALRVRMVQLLSCAGATCRV